MNAIIALQVTIQPELSPAENVDEMLRDLSRNHLKQACEEKEKGRIQVALAFAAVAEEFERRRRSPYIDNIDFRELTDAHSRRIVDETLTLLAANLEERYEPVADELRRRANNGGGI